MRFRYLRDRGRRWVAAGAAVFAAWFAAGWLAASPETGAEAPAQPATGPDPLVERGYAVAGGAAPGYVEDRVCGSCHADLYRSYQEVAMARSFYRPRPENLVK